MKQIILLLGITGIVLNTHSQENKIESTGNVGIGTTSPNALLHIKKNQSGWLQEIAGTAPNESDFVGLKILSGYAGETGKWIGISAISESLHSNQTGLGLYTDKIERLRIDHKGNIGIGISEPLYKLHVIGNQLGESVNNKSILSTVEGKVGGNYSKFQILNKRNGSGSDWLNTSLRLQRVVDATEMAFIDFGIDGKNGNYGLAFGTRNGFNGTQQTRIVIEGDGNVGIGTIHPGSWKLAVNGNIRAKEIKVETGWSDFIFYDDYLLPTLQEVENHIREKGHLKDIPSAKEVKENGIFLGEMDSKLLQKIEELTLYTIQQEKQLEKQSKEIERLKILVQQLIETKK